jgi:hypothetical protein
MLLLLLAAAACSVVCSTVHVPELLLCDVLNMLCCNDQLLCYYGDNVMLWYCAVTLHRAAHALLSVLLSGSAPHPCHPLCKGSLGLYPHPNAHTPQCTHTPMHTHPNAHTPQCTHTPMHTHPNAHTPQCTHTPMHTHPNAHTPRPPLKLRIGSIMLVPCNDRLHCSAHDLLHVLLSCLPPQPTAAGHIAASDAAVLLTALLAALRQTLCSKA